MGLVGLCFTLAGRLSDRLHRGMPGPTCPRHCSAPLNQVGGAGKDRLDWGAGRGRKRRSGHSHTSLVAAERQATVQPGHLGDQIPRVLAAYQSQGACSSHNGLARWTQVARRRQPGEPQQLPHLDSWHGGYLPLTAQRTDTGPLPRSSQWRAPGREGRCPGWPT